MPQDIPVVIIDSDTDAISAMVRCIEGLRNHVRVAGAVTSFEAGFELVHKKRPMVVIMEAGPDLDAATERIGSILKRFPRVSIFVTSSDTRAETILKVMRAGAAEYLLRPVADEYLVSALQKVGRLWITEAAPEAPRGKVYVLFSPKGGVGVTTMAVNLSTNIYKATGKPTVIVDLDLDAGDVTTFLNMKAAYTITDVTTNMTRLDENFLKGVITKHDSGIHVLAEPQRVEDGIKISGADVTKLIGLLKTMFDYIIIDTCTAPDDRTMAAIRASDMLMLVLVMSLPGIKHMQRHLHYFDKTGVKGDKIRLVVNRYMKKGDIKIEDAEKVLGRKVDWSVPNDYETAMSCLNKGVPFCVGEPRSAVNASIADIAGKLTKPVAER